MSFMESTASSPSGSSVASESAAQSSTVADNTRRMEAVGAADSSFASDNSKGSRMAIPPADRKRRLTSTDEDVRLQRTRSGSAAGPSTTRTALPNRSTSLVLPVSRSRPSVFAASGSSYATAIDISSSPPAPPSGLDNNRHGSRCMQASLLENSTPRPSRHSTYVSSHSNEDEDYMGFTRPRWQPDSEATSCPICATVFSFWYRKHHCRKCGRVVCASCSPHRITIPRQYIVRPPESLSTSPPLPATSPTATPSRSPQIFDPIGEDVTSFLSTVNPALGGGEEVRLCNPCVPDPNPNPPQPFSTVRPYGHRSTQSLSSTDMGNVLSRSQREQGDPCQSRRTVGDHDRSRHLRDWSRRMSDHVREAVRETYPDIFVQGREVQRARRASQATADSEAQQNLELTTHDDGRGSLVTTLAPRAPRLSAVSERDLCPVCGQRFLSLTEENPMEVREAHIRECIDNHAVRSTHRDSTTSRQAPPVPPPLLSSVRMVKFTATEKDCLDEHGKVAECMICMEEYKVDDVLVRLECLCKFHLDCLENWFQKKSECPVHFRPE